MASTLGAACSAAVAVYLAWQAAVTSIIYSYFGMKTVVKGVYTFLAGALPTTAACGQLSVSAVLCEPVARWSCECQLEKHEHGSDI